MNKLLNMDLHEIIHPSTAHPVSIMRVPNGWIYTQYHETEVSSVFVPFGPDQLLSDRGKEKAAIGEQEQGE